MHRTATTGCLPRIFSSPYLTVSEGLRLAAQTFTRDIALLSCYAS
jgi:hypothetical protein